MTKARDNTRRKSNKSGGKAAGARPGTSTPEEPEPLDLYLDRQRLELIQQLADQLTSPPDWADDLQSDVRAIAAGVTTEIKKANRRLENRLTELVEESQDRAEAREKQLDELQEHVRQLPKLFMSGDQKTATRIDGLEGQVRLVRKELSDHARDLASLRELLELADSRQAEQNAVERSTFTEISSLAQRLARPWYKRLLG